MATRPPELARGKRSLLQEVPSPTSGGQARLDPDRSAKDIRLGAGRYSRESSRVVDSAPPRGRPGGSSPAAAPALQVPSGPRFSGGCGCLHSQLIRGGFPGVLPSSWVSPGQIRDTRSGFGWGIPPSLLCALSIS
jgi:hypothetical protein